MRKKIMPEKEKEWVKDYQFNKVMQEEGLQKVVSYYTKIKNMEDRYLYELL